MAPSVSVDVAKGHSVHLDAPKLFEYEPTGHMEHSGVPYVDQYPGLQASLKKKFIFIRSIQKPCLYRHF